MQTIPLVDVRAEYEPLIPRLEAAFREVLVRYLGYEPGSLPVTGVPV